MKIWSHALIATAILSAPAGQVLAQDNLSELARTDPNSFVRSVQQALQVGGVYEGAISGILDQQTISAINAACRAAGVLAECQVGPLSPVGAAAVASAVRNNDAQVSPADAIIGQSNSPSAPQSELTSPGDAVLVSKGDDLDGWTTKYGTSSVVDGRFRVTTGDDGFSVRQYVTFPTEAGSTYLVEAESFPGTAAAALGISETENISGAVLFAENVTGTYSGSFVATTDQYVLLLVVIGAQSGTFAEFDNITIQQKLTE